MNVCNSVLDVASSPSCQLITAERWTQIDPDDANPWIRLDHEAVARHDTATADEALYRASLARSFRSGRESLLGYAEPALAKGFSEADRLQLEWDVWVATTALNSSVMHETVRQCSEEATQDSSRQQTCDAFATMLLERSSDLIDFRIGVRMAERLHWPAERLACFSAVDAPLSLPPRSSDTSKLASMPAPGTPIIPHTPRIASIPSTWELLSL